ncbi:AraC family transcriptional regulator ligand-binding domain-containing protein [Microbulbifer bruguierae]|uniref:AraC family transcriptional regulator ligand-binding domain-containing protein n=1 Tax=Microbulbifer bruguierae TaxID=3029061 RepID=A0ABY8NGW0_9GAMM|nr:AraC family transcriptional regulator ligand-binding domain-containing protein [Microbulbifer bruguierae]WGL17644.1 AraC family transcriptional regulator ligand-binding domain-containing protein [Microbulbifer bruguierae]
MTEFVRAGSLNGYDELARKMGANPVQLQKSVGLPSSQLRDPDNLIPYEKLGKLMELTARETAQTFGLRLGIGQGLRILGLFGAYMSRQDNITNALAVGSKHTHLHAQGAILTMEPTQTGDTELKLDILIAQTGRFPQLMALSIGLVYQLIRDMAGHQWHSSRVFFRHPPPEKGKDLYTQLFSCPVEFNAEHDGFYIDRETLRKKPRALEGLVNEIIFSQFEQIKTSSDNDLTPLVKHAILGLLPTGDCSKTNVALCLDMHPKKLQRTLESSNTSFRMLLEETRREVAETAVYKSSMSLTSIALNLGYADLAVFSRSFRRWFGIPPSMVERRRQYKGFG